MSEQIETENRIENSGRGSKDAEAVKVLCVAGKAWQCNSQLSLL